MKIALLAPGAVPAVQGGAENLWAGLMRAFNQLPAVKAEFVCLSSSEQSILQVLQGYERFGRLDLKGHDRVVSTKYPAWACPHPNHVVYLQHTLRGLYDTYPADLGFWLSLEQARALKRIAQGVGGLSPSNSQALCLSLELASAPSWQFNTRCRAVHEVETVFSARGATTASLAGWLVQLLQSLEHHGQAWALQFPGRLARACVRLLDAVALAPSRIRSYAAISRTVARREDYFPSGADVQVHHHPSALDQPFAQDLESASRDILLAPSRLEAPKRLDLIIRAYQASGLTVPLWLVGTGPDEAHLRLLASQAPGVVMKGFLETDELIHAYLRAQFVVFTPVQEDYGLITVEAFKAGTPVLTCRDAGGPTELVVHGLNGFVAEATVQGLAKGFDYLGGLASEDRTRMGEQGRQWADSQLSWSRLAGTLAGLYLPSPWVFRSKDSPSRAQPTAVAAPGLLAGGDTRAAGRLLVLNSFPIEPAVSGGRQRMLHLYHAVAERFLVSMISLSFSDEQPVLRRHSQRFQELRLPVSAQLAAVARDYETHLGVSCFDACIAHQPALLSYAFPFLESELRQAQAVIFAHPYWYPAYETFVARLGFRLPAWAQKPLVYEAHNVEGRLKEAIYPKSLFASQLANCVAATEARLVTDADLVSACSQEDADHLGWMAGPEPRTAPRSVVVVPNGLAFDHVRYQGWRDRLARARARGYKLAIFMGSSHQPNLEAATLITQAAALAPPGWSFVILGGCGQGLERAEGLENLVCPGLVTEEEKSLWLDEVTLGLNPMVSGSGTNLKLAEYAAWGLPVMASPLGARGWDWQPGAQFIVCEVNPQSLLKGLEAFDVFIEQSKSEDEAIRQQAELLNWRRLGAVFSQHIASCVTPA